MTVKTLLLVGTALIVTGCSTRYDVDGARELPNQGDAFTQELQRGYADLAEGELNEGDYTDTEFFVAKSRAAASGGVAPQDISDRALPGSASAEAQNAKTRLAALLADSTVRAKAPDALARAQVAFDCWMQEQEENNQPADIAACKNVFDAAIAEAESLMAPPAPPPAPEAGNDFELFFDFDSPTLTTEARVEIDKVLDAMIQLNPNRIIVIGHTDTSGSDAYNTALGLKRANNVSKALQKIGLSADMIDVRSSGESDLKVQTADGVKEAMNRRVQILLQ